MEYVWIGKLIVPIEHLYTQSSYLGSDSSCVEMWSEGSTLERTLSQQL